MNRCRKFISCDICPHKCLVESNQFGKCNVWKNLDGRVHNPFEGHCSLITVEPVEKKPFFHYKPGTKCLSVGFLGCSLNCDYCQNFTVSQSTAAKTIYYSPADLVGLCEEKHLSTIAFTYNEPTLYWHYIQQVANNADVLVKTNGFAEKWVFEELMNCSGFNIDIKGNEHDYQNVCKGSLDPVLKSVEFLSRDKHVEISYLIMPERIDDYKFHSYLRDFLAELHDPVHLLYFYPFHRMNIPTYPPESILRVADFFKEKIKYVYPSNIYRSDIIPFRDTVCFKCGDTMIHRSSGKTEIKKLRCCGEKIQGIW